MANNKNTPKEVSQISENSEARETTTAVENSQDSQDTQTPKLYEFKEHPKDTKLRHITTLNKIHYYYGTPQESENPKESKAFTLEQLEAEISNAKTAKIAELNATCDSLLVSFKSSATGVERIYDSEVEDQLNILALVAAGVDSYFRCALPGATKENVKHTAAQMKQVFADGLKYKSVIIGICGILKAFVESQYSIDRINSINWAWFDTNSQTIIDPADIQNTSTEENSETTTEEA